MRDIAIYNSSSFDHSTIEKVSLSTWITTSSARYIRIVLTACICNRFQFRTFMVIDFSSHKRVSINPYWMSTSFTLACHKEKLFFPSNLLISILIDHFFSIFSLAHHRCNHVLVSPRSDTTYWMDVWPRHHLPRPFRYCAMQQEERRNKIENNQIRRSAKKNSPPRSMQASL